MNPKRHSLGVLAARCGAAVRDDLVSEGHVRWDMCQHRFEAVDHRLTAFEDQALAIDADDEEVTCREPELGSELRRYDEPSLVAKTYLGCHDCLSMPR